MKFRSFARHGFNGSALGFGAWAIEERYSEKFLRENIAARLEQNPTPFKVLRPRQREGLLGLSGVSTQEFDQHRVIEGP